MWDLLSKHLVVNSNNQNWRLSGGYEAFEVMPGSKELITFRGYKGTDTVTSDLYQLSATENSLIFHERVSGAWRTIWEISAKASE